MSGSSRSESSPSESWQPQSSPSEPPRLDEQMISQAVQAGLSSQLDAADEVTVEVHTDLGKAVQGKADAVSVSGQGVVVQDIRLETMEVHTDRLSLNPLSVLFGKPELDHPTDATARVTLTEGDLNRLMNAESVRQRIPPLLLNVDGETVKVELQYPIAVQIPAAGKLALAGAASLQTATATRSVKFSVVLVPRTERQPLLLESFVCHPGQGLSIAFTVALLNKFQEILAQPYLDIEGMAVQVVSLQVQLDRVIVETQAHLRQIPTL